MNKPKPLMSRHQAFAEAYVVSPNGAAAYKKSYPNVRQATAKVNAARLLTNANVCAEIERLRTAGSRKATVLSLSRKRQLLYEFAEDSNEDTSQRLKSIELDAKLAGELSGLDQTPVVMATPQEILEVVRMQAVELYGRAEDVDMAPVLASGNVGALSFSLPFAWIVLLTSEAD